MNISGLQTRLAELGCYRGPIDGQFGPATRQAVMSGMQDGPDYRLDAADIQDAAARLGVEAAAIMAVRDVEASASPFIDGKPTILFEPHRFSRATGHRFDASHPAISSSSWNRKLYPKTQAGRWSQLLDACALDVDAAFASASYGAFQILGENFAVCGTRDPFAFAWQESQTEADQLEHFCRFVEGNHLTTFLKARDWAGFAKRYNGSAYRENQYDTRLAQAYARRKPA